jgi:hypothetical protein
MSAFWSGTKLRLLRRVRPPVRGREAKRMNTAMDARALIAALHPLREHLSAIWLPPSSSNPQLEGTRVQRPQPLPVAFQQECCHTPCWKPKGSTMKRRTEMRQGTLAGMVLKTLDVREP